MVPDLYIYKIVEKRYTARSFCIAALRSKKRNHHRIQRWQAGLPHNCKTMIPLSISVLSADL